MFLFKRKWRKKIEKFKNFKHKFMYIEEVYESTMMLLMRKNINITNFA